VINVSLARNPVINPKLTGLFRKSGVKELNKHLQAWVRLNLAEGMGISRKLELLRMLKTPEAIFEMDRKDWDGLGLKPAQADSLLSEDKLRESAEIIRMSEKKGIRIIPMDDEEYPELLRYIQDPPLVLYVKGVIPKGLGLGIVGSRKATGYGMNTAFRLASELAEEGFIIVSGMARGIDTAAHTGALHAGGQTMAVLGCGPDQAYPPENRGLMDRIARNGAVISEYPPGVKPQTYHFPVRNRVISGICIGVLVVEAGQKSGSLITAQAALEQGREVFAIPGNINHHTSMGTNRLIREGAKLVLSIQDILEEIPWSLSALPVYRKSSAPGTEPLSREESLILQTLRAEDLYHDQIAERTGVPRHVLFAALLQLEIRGLVRKDLTGRYAIVSDR